MFLMFQRIELIDAAKSFLCTACTAYQHSHSESTQPSEPSEPECEWCEFAGELFGDGDAAAAGNWFGTTGTMCCMYKTCQDYPKHISFKQIFGMRCGSCPRRRTLVSSALSLDGRPASELEEHVSLGLKPPPPPSIQR